MIKLEHTVLASPEQMNFIIEGMRNPMNSWAKSDSRFDSFEIHDGEEKYWTTKGSIINYGYSIGENDMNLMKRLAKSGTDHRKYLRMMPVYVRITAPLYWWKEFDTYKIGTVSNSCSTMHKIHAKKLTLDDFSTEHLTENCISNLELIIARLNIERQCYMLYDTNHPADVICKKDIWWQMIQLLPSSYNQTRNVMLNYEVLANIYRSRRNHKLDEWHEFCDWIENLEYSELIIDLSKGEIETKVISTLPYSIASDVINDLNKGEMETKLP